MAQRTVYKVCRDTRANLELMVAAATLLEFELALVTDEGHKLVKVVDGQLVDATDSLAGSFSDHEARISALEGSGYIRFFSQYDQPTNPAEGDEWHDPANDLVRQYISGQWQIITYDNRLASDTENVVFNGGYF